MNEGTGYNRWLRLLLRHAIGFDEWDETTETKAITEAIRPSDKTPMCPPFSLRPGSISANAFPQIRLLPSMKGEDNGILKHAKGCHDQPTG